MRSTVHDMAKNSALGSLARKAIAAIILVAVAVLLFKVLVAAVVGVLSVIFGFVVVAAVVLAVIWAVRNL
jgi:fatty-acid desaturase